MILSYNLLNCSDIKNKKYIPNIWYMWGESISPFHEKLILKWKSI